MRKAKPAPSGKRSPYTTDEPGASFGLIEYVGRAGTTHLLASPGPSFVLVLAGDVEPVPAFSHVRHYGVGEGFCFGGVQLLEFRRAGALWHVTGSAELVAALGRFAAQLARKDPATAAHAARVAGLVAAMGRTMGLRPPRLERLCLAAYLHDLGKLGLPRSLLQAATSLPVAAWRLMTCHPREGRRLLEATPLAFAAAVAEEHHERLDGSGYPAGLRGDEIALESAVVAVADTFDAITCGRPYQKPRTVQEALSEINRYSGVLFAPSAVGALNAVVRSRRGSPTA